MPPTKRIHGVSVSKKALSVLEALRDIGRVWLINGKTDELGKNVHITTLQTLVKAGLATFGRDEAGEYIQATKDGEEVETAIPVKEKVDLIYKDRYNGDINRDYLQKPKYTVIPKSKNIKPFSVYTNRSRDEIMACGDYADVVLVWRPEKVEC